MLAYPNEYKSFNNRTTKSNDSHQGFIYLFRNTQKLQQTVFYGLSKRGIESYIKPNKSGVAQYVQYKLPKTYFKDIVDLDTDNSKKIIKNLFFSNESRSLGFFLNNNGNPQRRSNNSSCSFEES